MNNIEGRVFKRSLSRDSINNDSDSSMISDEVFIKPKKSEEKFEKKFKQKSKSVHEKNNEQLFELNENFSKKNCNNSTYSVIEDVKPKDEEVEQIFKKNFQKVERPIKPMNRELLDYYKNSEKKTGKNNKESKDSSENEEIHQQLLVFENPGFQKSSYNSFQKKSENNDKKHQNKNEEKKETKFKLIKNNENMNKNQKLLKSIEPLIKKKTKLENSCIQELLIKNSQKVTKNENLTRNAKINKPENFSKNQKFTKDEVSKIETIPIKKNILKSVDIVIKNPKMLHKKEIEQKIDKMPKESKIDIVVKTPQIDKSELKNKKKSFTKPDGLIKSKLIKRKNNNNKLFNPNLEKKSSISKRTEINFDSQKAKREKSELLKLLQKSPKKKNKLEKNENHLKNLKFPKNINNLKAENFNLFKSSREFDKQPLSNFHEIKLDKSDLFRNSRDYFKLQKLEKDDISQKSDFNQSIRKSLFYAKANKQIVPDNFKDDLSSHIDSLNKKLNKLEANQDNILKTDKSQRIINTTKRLKQFRKENKKQFIKTYCEELIKSKNLQKQNNNTEKMKLELEAILNQFQNPPIKKNSKNNFFNNHLNNSNLTPNYSSIDTRKGFNKKTIHNEECKFCLKKFSLSQIKQHAKLCLMNYY